MNNFTELCFALYMSTPSPMPEMLKWYKDEKLGDDFDEYITDQRPSRKINVSSMIRNMKTSHWQKGTATINNKIIFVVTYLVLSDNKHGLLALVNLPLVYRKISNRELTFERLHYMSQNKVELSELSACGSKMVKIICEPV